MPYDPKASIENQVKTSIASSLKNLRTTDGTAYIDCLVLHSPLSTLEDTLLAWKVLEAYVPHTIRTLGISNLTLPLLESLWKDTATKIKPAVVQIRFYPKTGFEVPLRKFCRANDIIFQSFWTLTANPGLLTSQPVKALALGAQISEPVALYRLVLGLANTVILDGTTNETTMREDLEGIRRTETFIEENPDQWTENLAEFKRLIREQ